MCGRLGFLEQVVVFGCLFIYEGKIAFLIFIIFRISVKSLYRQGSNVLDTPGNSQMFMSVDVFVDV